MALNGRTQFFAIMLDSWEDVLHRDVERNRAGHIDIEMAQRVIELEPAARYPRMFLAADL